MNMKKIHLAIFAFVIILFSSAFSFLPSPKPLPATQEIEWLTWQQAQDKMKTAPKKIMIDVYTDWCGWCKRMDATTFQDPKIVQAMNKNFYAVKLDAEQREEIIFDNHSFKFIPFGNKGHHELAASLLDNSMSYPSFVVLDETMNRLMIIKGFQQVSAMLCVLDFTGADHHKTKTYEDFKATWAE